MADKGFWVDPTEPYPKPIRCPHRQCLGSNRCAGSWDNATVVCSRCLPGHSQWGSSCARCGGASGALILVVLVAIFVFVLVELKEASTVAGGTLKITVYFMQMLALILQVNHDSNSVLGLLYVSESLSFSGGVTLCLFPIPAVFNFYSPLVLLGLFYLMLGLQFLLHFLLARSGRWLVALWQQRWDMYPQAAVELLLVSNYQIVASFLKFCFCYDVGPTRDKVLFFAPSVTCYTAGYWRHFAVLSLAALVCVFTTFLLFYVFWRRVHGLPFEDADRLVFSRFPAVFKIYAVPPRPPTLPIFAPLAFLSQWWELVFFARRLVYVLVIVFVMPLRDQGQEFNLYFMILSSLNCGFLVLHLVLLPFQHKTDNLAEAGCLVATQVICSFSMRGTAYDGSPGSLPVNIAVAVVQLLTVAALVCVIVKQLGILGRCISNNESLSQHAAIGGGGGGGGGADKRKDYSPTTAGADRGSGPYYHSPAVYSDDATTWTDNRTTLRHTTLQLTAPATTQQHTTQHTTNNNSHTTTRLLTTAPPILAEDLVMLQFPTNASASANAPPVWSTLQQKKA